MNKTELLITPAEAIRLGNMRNIGDFSIVQDITAEFQSGHSADEIKANEQYYTWVFLVTIWNAGRVQGIREERKKKNVSISAETPTKTATVPRLNIKQMSDYQWQLNCLNDRLEHPEKYAPFENVQERIEHLRKWLAEHKESE